jgi:hypothetical protein
MVVGLTIRSTTEPQSLKDHRGTEKTDVREPLTTPLSYSRSQSRDRRLDQALAVLYSSRISVKVKQELAVVN